MTKLHALLAPVLMTGAVLAQMPEPAAELKKLEPMVGNWESKGTMNQPGMPPMEWTAKSQTSWALGGHALQEDMAIEFAGMAPLVMRSYTTWDREYGVYRAFSVNNMGEISESTLEWLDDHTIVQFTTGSEEGMPFGERWVTKVKDGKIEFASTRMSGTEEAVEVIQGTGHKVDGIHEIDLHGAGPFIPTPVSAEMKRAAKMVGHYELAAETVPAPGAEAMPVTGETHAHSLFGGLVLFVQDNGTSFPYESEHWMTWSAEDGAFRHVALNNMGLGMMSPGHWVDGAMVFTSATRMQGQPAVDATVLRVDDEGKLAGITSHMTLGTAAPFKAFDGTWKAGEN